MSLRSHIGFLYDVLLQPLSIKWACGADPEPELARLYAFATEFAYVDEKEDIAAMVDGYRQDYLKTGYIGSLFEKELTTLQLTQLCTASSKLNVEWLTPAAVTLELNQAMGKDQAKVLREFNRLIATF